MIILILILILTANVDADGFYGFGIKGVGWSAFSGDLGLTFSDLSLSCYSRLDRIGLGVLDSFYLSQRRRASIGCICMSVERSLGV